MKKKIIKILKIVLIIIFSINIIKLVNTLIYKDNAENNQVYDNNEINNDINDIYDMSQYKSYDDISILQYEKGSVKERLKNFAKKDNRINKILDNYDDYNEDLLEALSRNIELTTFVINYNEKKDKVYSDNIGVIDNFIPEIYQWDERWGYGSYGSSNIAISGCGPTALAMVVAGLKHDNTITPYKVAKFAERNGYYVENSGTTWDLIRKGGIYYGLNVKEISLSESTVLNALRNGHPIICSMRKGDFTINGHYIVLVGLENGKIKINDPNSKIRSSYLWDYSRIKSQIKNLWEFSL